MLGLVDDIGIAGPITLVASNTDTSIKPAELWNEESSKVGPPPLCGERDGDDRPREDICGWIVTLVVDFPDIDNSVKMLAKMLNVANVLLNAHTTAPSRCSTHATPPHVHAATAPQLRNGICRPFSIHQTGSSLQDRHSPPTRCLFVTFGRSERRLQQAETE